jgi:uncharacterized membrane protein YsdA (DUF1294 family)
MRSPKLVFFVISIIFVFALAVLLLWLTDLHFYWVWLLALSLVTFAFYGFDKIQAKRSGLRVPEIVLHGLSLAGGFLGGWLGMTVFHHKTRKPVFTVVLIVATVLNIGVIYLLFLR